MRRSHRTDQMRLSEKTIMSRPLSTFACSLGVGLALTTVGACGSSPTGAVPTDTSPVISDAALAFTSDRDGNMEIYLADEDGSVVANATRVEGDDYGPTWSPVANRIAFWSTRDGHAEVYVMNRDGSDPVRLTHGGGDEPDWSPDGSKIAFGSDRDGNREIYVMDADGSNAVNVTRDPGVDVGPKWSPDGTRILFTTDRDGNGNWELYTIDEDGSDPRNLTNDPDVDFRGFSWSPDGTRIAFTRGLTHRRVFVMDADGSNQLDLSVWDQSDPGTKVDMEPVWSPNGTRILYTGDEDYRWQIFAIDPDGGNRVNLTNALGDWGLRASWSRDGTRIAYQGGRDGTDGTDSIYLMNADGSGVTRITLGADHYYDPVWVR